ncbi:MAG: 3-hydroxyacyl-CoA dehydrogenase NAD-binding domain-containing protein [Planctomycetota bacterium]
MNLGNYRNLTVTRSEIDVVDITIDVIGHPVNVFNEALMQELSQVVGELESCAHVKLVIFRSGKESGFFAGADVEIISSIRSAGEASRLVTAGQDLFERIERLSATTLALIDGMCLGGGLELALACDIRLARHCDATRIGLPEIKLGLIPGWGGTQRLPRRIRLSRAIDLILSGRMLTAKQADRVGLIDQAIDPEIWEPMLDAWKQALAEGRLPAKRGGEGLIQGVLRLLESTGPGRRLVMAMVRKQTKRLSVSYPAIPAALRAIEAGFGRRPEGMLRERIEFVELLATPTCRHLLSLYFARQKAQKVASWLPSEGRTHAEEGLGTHRSQGVSPGDQIQRVGVVGAGAMGAGIAQLCATRGFEVVVREIDDESLERGRRTIERLLRSLAKRKAWPESRVKQTVDRIRFTTAMEAFADCDLVIEAVVERMEVKKAVFASLAEVVGQETILATNTSALSVTEMGMDVPQRERFAGLHFFNPVGRMELVELVKTGTLSRQNLRRLLKFVKAIGKTPVVTEDVPGFLVNRVLFPYLAEALGMVFEGTDVKKLDSAARRFGMPMGPMELLDTVGLDVALHVAETLPSSIAGDPAGLELLRKMVERGMLGKKSGRGFYVYGRKRRVADLGRVLASNDPVPSGEVRVSQHQEIASRGWDAIQTRLVSPLLLQSYAALEQGVVKDAEAIDLAMVLGTGYAPHLGGPLHTIDAIGVSTFVSVLDQLRFVHGSRFEVPAGLRKLAADNRRIVGLERETLDRANEDIGGRVASLHSAP